MSCHVLSFSRVYPSETDPFGDRPNSNPYRARTWRKGPVSFEVCDRYDQSEWDCFVSSHAAGNICQSYAWGVFQRSHGWEPRYAVLSAEDRMIASALLLHRSIPGLGPIVVAPRGPVVDFTDPLAVGRMLDHLANYTRKSKATFLRCDPYWRESEGFDVETPPTVLERVPRDWSSWNLPRLVFWLDLSGDEEAVMGRMTSRCRNDVRRGYRNGVVFREGGKEDLEDFYRLMVLTAEHKGIAVRGIEYYEELLTVIGQSAGIQLFVGSYEGEVVTSGISAAYGSTGTLFYAASAPSSYKLRANRTQQWEMIKWAHSQGCTRYDFRGTATNDPPSKDDPGYGVYQFKKSFGPEFTRLTGYYDIVNRSARHRVFRAAEDQLLPIAYKARTILQSLPGMSR